MELNKDYYSVREIAEMLSVEHQAIRRAIKQGKLQAIKVGRVLRISRESLQSYMDANKA